MGFEVTVKSLFRPTTEQDQPRLTKFLASAFSVPSNAEFLRPDLLQWKYWSPREDYGGARSYVLEQNGEIVAHAGIWPMLLQTGSQKAQGCHMIDWASASHAPGSGVTLVKKLCERFDFIYAIGGSEMTRSILPLFGFEEVGQTWSAARPLRPLRQMLAHRYHNWKIPARFVRNAVWSAFPLNRNASRVWTIEDEILNQPEAGGQLPEDPPFALRSKAFFRYLQSCPVAEIRTFQLHKNGQNAGRLALSTLYKQSRVVGIWLNDWSSEGLQAAYGLAQQAARSMSVAYEIVALGSTSLSEAAAVSAGLRVVKRMPVYVWKGKTSLPSPQFDFQIADNDAVFLSTGRPDFLT